VSDVTTVGHVTIFRHEELSPQRHKGTNREIIKINRAFVSLWLVLFVVDFFDEAAAHEAGRDERGSVIVHLFQQLLATVVDEANTRQINQKRGPPGGFVVPALVQFIDARARELSFKDKPRDCGFIVTSDSNYFISHAPQPRAICLPQLTLKAFANFRPWLERSDNHGIAAKTIN